MLSGVGGGVWYVVRCVYVYIYILNFMCGFEIVYVRLGIFLSVMWYPVFIPHEIFLCLVTLLEKSYS